MCDDSLGSDLPAPSATSRASTARTATSPNQPTRPAQWRVSAASTTMRPTMNRQSGSGLSARTCCPAPRPGGARGTCPDAPICGWLVGIPGAREWELGVAVFALTDVSQRAGSSDERPSQDPGGGQPADPARDGRFRVTLGFRASGRACRRPRPTRAARAPGRPGSGVAPRGRPGAASHPARRRPTARRARPPRRRSAPSRRGGRARSVVPCTEARRASSSPRSSSAVAALLHADHDKPAAGRQTAQVRGEPARPEHVQDHVGAPALGHVAHPGDQVLAPVVDPDVGAQRHATRDSVRPAGSCQGARARARARSGWRRCPRPRCHRGSARSGRARGQRPSPGSTTRCRPLPAVMRRRSGRGRRAPPAAGRRGTATSSA